MDNDNFFNNNINKSNKINNSNRNNAVNNNSNNNSLPTAHNSLHKYKYFMTLILVGYFGIKIFLGSFNKFPEKFYEKELVIKTNDICNVNKNPNKYDTEEEGNVDQSLCYNTVQDNLVMNYFIPGVINNEIYDIVITVILSSIVFLITGMYKRKSFGFIAITNFIFIMGYMIGLNAPLYKSLFEGSANYLSYFYLLTLIVIMSFMVLLSSYGAYNSNGLSMNNGLAGYILYMIILSILIIGLIVNRKKIKTNNTIIYTTNTNTRCNTIDYGAYQSSGEYVKISMTFIAFILLFIFVYDPPNHSTNILYYFINGVLLGIFVAGMSFYGFEYFLNKKPDYYCNSKEDCEEKSISIGKKVLEYNDSNELNILKWLVGIIAVIMIMIVIYLFYNK